MGLLMALLSLQEISVRFGGPWLLEGATLNVERGERICLLGRNGEGKSTLLKVAAGHSAGCRRVGGRGTSWCRDAAGGAGGVAGNRACVGAAGDAH